MPRLTIPAPVRYAAAATTVAALTTLAVAPPASAAGATSQATSQSVYVNLLNGTGTVALSNPQTSSADDGTQSSNVVDQSAPLISVLNGTGGLTFLTAGVGSEYTSADTDGSSFACTEIAGSGATVQVGTATTPCTFDAGNANTGVTLDLGAIPNVGTSLASIADVKVHLSALSAFAGESAGGTVTRSAALTGGTVVITLAGGVVPAITVPLPIPADPNSNLLTTIANAVAGQGNPLLGPLSTALSTTLAPVVDLVTNYQPPAANGTSSVSALHVALLDGSGAVANLATASVGPNATTPAGSVFPTSGLPVTGVAAVAAAAVIAPWYRRRRRLAGATS